MLMPRDAPTPVAMALLIIITFSRRRDDVDVCFHFPYRFVCQLTSLRYHTLHHFA